MPIVVREALPEQAQLIADLTRAAWANRINLSANEHWETAVNVGLDLRNGGGFLLLIQEIPVGSVRWVPHEAEPNIWEILRLGILPAHRGEHLSQHLIEAVVHHALETGADELRLAVPHDQPSLLDFYTALGFEIALELESVHINPSEPMPHMMRKFLQN
jgi:ribosomal protein S18 acetylase RimI-like enzyme